MRDKMWESKKRSEAGWETLSFNSPPQLNDQTAYSECVLKVLNAHRMLKLSEASSARIYKWKENRARNNMYIDRICFASESIRCEPKPTYSDSRLRNLMGLIRMQAKQYGHCIGYRFKSEQRQCDTKPTRKDVKLNARKAKSE